MEQIAIIGVTICMNKTDCVKPALHMCTQANYTI